MVPVFSFSQYSIFFYNISTSFAFNAITLKQIKTGQSIGQFYLDTSASPYFMGIPA